MSNKAFSYFNHPTSGITPAWRVSGSDLDAWMCDKKISSTLMATKLGVSRSTIYNWTAGRALAPMTLLAQLAHHFGSVPQQGYSTQTLQSPIEDTQVSLEGWLRVHALSRADLASHIGVGVGIIRAWVNQGVVPDWVPGMLNLQFGKPFFKPYSAATIEGTPLLVDPLNKNIGPRLPWKISDDGNVCSLPEEWLDDVDEEK